ncbi:putative addiction module killer protein [Desulfobacter postgatei 2ac9]|uniref:Putative addiction module killer protein n=2 Tax=Desulfobacter postgatei TaxID=2293 RepID=I5B0F3_9BACT|nr:putative addiction module killer protein [Desulfobacter postgatei 2ac9]
MRTMSKVRTVFRQIKNPDYPCYSYRGLYILFDFLYSNDYIFNMYIVKTLPEFDKWLDSLKDRITRLRLSRRLDKAQRGNLGDVKPVGEGVFEMREHFGPGWRMYYTKRGDTLIVMLGAGDKSSQESDIAKAKQRETTLED